MEFCTHAKKCVSRNNYGLLGRVSHEMHLALKQGKLGHSGQERWGGRREGGREGGILPIAISSLSKEER